MSISFRLNRKKDEEGQETPSILDINVQDSVTSASVESTVNSEQTVEDKPEETEEKMILRTDNLVKKYGKRTVANHVSIEVTQGEIVGLLGPNGAGKTTTFYMTTGLITPNEGRIFLNDMDITKFPVYKRAKNGIGYLAQDASVFRKLTVEDNIRCVLQLTANQRNIKPKSSKALFRNSICRKSVKTWATRSRVANDAVPRLPAVWQSSQNS